MCILCKEWLTSQLNIRELRTAGMELLSTTSDPDSLEHIMERIAELEKEIKE